LPSITALHAVSFIRCELVEQPTTAHVVLSGVQLCLALSCTRLFHAWLPSNYFIWLIYLHQLYHRCEPHI